MSIRPRAGSLINAAREEISGSMPAQYTKRYIRHFDPYRIVQE
jgi:hypothetical protein